MDCERLVAVKVYFSNPLFILVCSRKLAQVTNDLYCGGGSQCVTRSDKTDAQWLGRSRDNWRKHHMGVILSMSCFWKKMFTLLGVFSIVFLLLTDHVDLLHDFKTHFKMTTAYFDQSSVNPFISPFSRNGLSASTLFYQAITSIWRYAQFWNVGQIKVSWLYFLSVSITQNDQTDTVLTFYQSGAHTQ